MAFVVPIKHHGRGLLLADGSLLYCNPYPVSGWTTSVWLHTSQGKTVGLSPLEAVRLAESEAGEVIRQTEALSLLYRQLGQLRRDQPLALLADELDEALGEARLALSASKTDALI